MIHVAPGGELQRFAIAVVAAQNADIYMIDEPSSFLDVRQRLKAAQVWSSHPCAGLPLVHTAGSSQLRSSLSELLGFANDLV